MQEREEGHTWPSVSFRSPLREIFGDKNGAQSLGGDDVIFSDFCRERVEVRRET